MSRGLKILIATPLYPPDVGGPSYYAKALSSELVSLGHFVRVVSFGPLLSLPSGLRHLVYFLKIFPEVLRADFVIALDMFSAGLPAVLAGRFCGKKVIIRTGGDFLWESYVERTREKITLPMLYKNFRGLNLKERIVFKLTRFALQKASAVGFSTSWQRDIFIPAYGLETSKTAVIENFYAPVAGGSAPLRKNFVWAGRKIFLKNLDSLAQAFEEAKKEAGDIELEILENMLQGELHRRLSGCYAVINVSLSEVSPNIILEAIRFGRPFISTRETGIYERTKDVGLFADPLDSEDIKQKILFLADENNYRLYSEKLSRFNFTHSYREIAEEFISVYKRL